MTRVRAIEILRPGPPGEGMDPGQVAEIESAISQLTYRRYDVADPAYGAIRSTSEPSSSVKAANRAAIQAAADDAHDNDGVLVIRGDYWVDDTITFDCHMDASNGAIYVSDTTLAPVLRGGTDTPGERSRDKRVILPYVYQAGKSGLGSGVWGSDVGVEIANANSWECYIPKIQGFGTNLLITAYGQGNAYNAYHIGHLDNGKVNLYLVPETGGWVTDNEFFGGRLSHNGNEGSGVSGARQIKTAWNGVHKINNNAFYGPSLEGNVPEFHVDLEDANDTIFAPARWEASPPKVRLKDSEGNVFLYGYGGNTIQWTIEGSAPRNDWYHRWGVRLFGTSSAGALNVANSGSDTNHAIAVLASSSTLATDPATAYAVGISTYYTSFKGISDANARVRIDHRLSRIEFGGGSGAVDTTLRRYGTIGLRTDRKFLADSGIGVGNSVAATTPGTVVRKMEVFDADGNSLGFVPIYDAIS